MTKTQTKADPLVLDAEQRVDQLPSVRKPRAAAQHQEPMRTVAQPTTPMDLIAAAVARGSSTEEIGKLMDLLERHQRREAEQAFASAMVQFKKQVPTIIKDAGASFVAKGSKVEYDYATLGHICEQIIAKLADCGISHSWSPEQPSTGPDANMIIMTCTLTHEQAHTQSATFKFPADPTGTKNALQAIGSSGTYGERYSLLAVCGIAVKEQGDDDGRGAVAQPELNAPSQPAGKHAIDGANLARALASIKSKDYTYDDLVAYYALTPAQMAQVRKELGLDAEQ
jgi:hypothetical protein